MKTKLIHDQNSDNPRFRGLFHGIKEVFKEEGITGVYRGVAPTLGKQMGNQGIRFMVFEEIKKVRDKQCWDEKLLFVDCVNSFDRSLF